MRKFKMTTNKIYGVKRAFGNGLVSARTRTLLLACILPVSTLLYAASATPAQRASSKNGHAGLNKGAAGATTAGASNLNGQAGFAHDVLPMLQKYCVSCHTGKSAQAGIDLAHYKNVDGVLKDRDNWDRVAQAIGSSHMPPTGLPAPTKAQRDTLVNWVQATTSAADCKLNDPGHVTLRRLNRAEYNNTVRDLCGVDVHPADAFPNDDVGYGFDNIGDVLSISPLLMEKYVNAAEQVAHAAFENPDNFIKPESFTSTRLNYINQSSNVGDHASLYTTNSEAGADYVFPKNGDYMLRAVAWQDKAGPEAAKMELRLDGKPLTKFDVPNGARDPKPYQMRVTVPAGQHRLSAVFLNDFYDSSDPNNKRKGNRDRNLNVKALEIVGPLHGEDSDSPLAKQLGQFDPNDNTRIPVARKFLTDFTRRAYRRPVTQEEVDSLLRYVELAHKQNEPFQKGIEYAMTAAMCSPNFLFRVETTSAAPKAAGKSAARTVKSSGKSHLKTAGLTTTTDGASAKYLLGDYALASRLSYFLWSSMPDDELMALAAKGKLQDNAILAAQVKRMLKDSRSRALSDNFAGQWLQLRNLNNLTPDTARFPDFNDGLRRAMKMETELFFQSIVGEDRSVLDFLDAKYTFLNEQLAKHYGIDDVKGGNFRKVTLAGNQRGGILTQASLLTVTSNPTRTSPVKRGKWVMENLLGTPLPPAPPNVPALSDDKKGPLVGTLRQRMEQHRANPACASCHARMDPIGFGLENFDAVGGWRTKDGETSVDASGVLPDGAKFNGPSELKQILLSKKTEFVRCLATKLMTYALGRGVERTDKCKIDTIVETDAKNGYKFSALVTAIVLSDPFRKQRGDGGI